MKHPVRQTAAASEAATQGSEGMLPLRCSRCAARKAAKRRDPEGQPCGALHTSRDGVQRASFVQPLRISARRSIFPLRVRSSRMAKICVPELAHAVSFP